MLHLATVAHEAESRLPLEAAEGPVALLIVPTVRFASVSLDFISLLQREVAKQMFDELEVLADALATAGQRDLLYISPDSL